MVTRHCPPEIGGVERVVAALLTQLSRARPAWRVDAVSARPGRELGRAGLNVVWVGQAGYRQGLDVALAAVAEARQHRAGRVRLRRGR